MKKGILLLLSMVILVSVLLVSCRSKEDKTLKIGIIKPSVNHVPLSWMYEKGNIPSEKFKLVEFTSGWEVQEALIAHKIDAAIMPFTYAWTAVSKKRPIKIVSCLERETDGIVCPTSIQEVEQLAGKKIGTLRASTIEVLAVDMAKRFKFTYEPVYFRTPAEMIAALQAGEVSAIVCYVPLIQKLDKKFHVIYWFSDHYPEHPCCDFVITERASKHKMPLVRELYKQISKGVEELNMNPDELKAYLQSKYQLTSEQADNALKHTKFTYGISLSDKQFESSMMSTFKDMGYIDNLPEYKDVYLELH